MGDERARLDALRRTPFFARVPDEDLDAVLAASEPVAFAAGDRIVEQGDTGDGMYVVTAGTAEVDVGGRYHKLTSGDFFGEMALIAGRKRMATVIAAEPVEALKIPAEGFEELLVEHPRIALSMMRALADRLMEVQQRVDAWMAP